MQRFQANTILYKGSEQPWILVSVKGGWILERYTPWELYIYLGKWNGRQGLLLACAPKSFA